MATIVGTTYDSLRTKAIADRSRAWCSSQADDTSTCRRSLMKTQWPASDAGAPHTLPQKHCPCDDAYPVVQHAAGRLRWAHGAGTATTMAVARNTFCTPNACRTSIQEACAPQPGKADWTSWARGSVEPTVHEALFEAPYHWWACGSGFLGAPKIEMAARDWGPRP